MSATAHAPNHALRLRAVPCALAAALLATPTHALMLGEPQVRSYLGRPLDLRIPVSGTGADAVDASCFAILGEAQGGMSVLARARLEIEQVGASTYLRVRSTEAMTEPATLLRLRAACPPTNGILVRQYGILLDPLPASTPSAPLVVDASSPAANDAVQVAAVTAQPEAAKPAVQAKPKARHRATHKSQITAKSQATTHARHSRHTQVATGATGFHLKLSGPVLDLERSAHVSDAQRAQLREARMLMDGDDYASAMLALRDRIESLQKRLEGLQAQAARIEGSARAKPAAVPTVAAREPSAVNRFAEGAWSWALVALLGLAALLAMPIARWLRRRKPDEVAELVVNPRKPDKGTETGRFAPPPPEVIAPAVPTPVNAGPIAMEDTEEAIRTARDLYNSGERLQAAGVLRLAIESHPERVAPWLPLFDLLMRERLATEYAELARGFRLLHGSSPAWKTVQRAGLQMDPSNPLYADEGEARQVAA